MRAPLPAGEIRRLETLRNYGVVDTPPEPVYDDLAALAAQICQTPIALVSLVDARRQWFKSKVGLAAAETPRDVAFCAHTILDRDKVLEVRDAAADPRFAESDLVKGEAHIRYYAGAPLVAPDGHAVGALCVMDRSPRALSAEQLTALRTLSRQVVAQFEFQRQARELAAEIAERQRAEIQLQQQYNFLAAGKVEADRLLDVAQKSRRALLSVLEDEKRAEAEVREKAAFISNVINSLTAHIVVLDGAGKIIEANRAWNEFAAANDVPAEAHGFLGCNYITACLQSAALMKALRPTPPSSPA